jgi:hypothetical protein
MGVSLLYQPTTTPPANTAELIIREAAALSRLANHWCEPYFFLRGDDGALTGLTKVSLPGYTAADGNFVAVEPGDDMFMMAQEIELLLRGVAGWARAYRLEWRIQFEGSPIGTVDSTGAYSPDLRAFLVELHSAAQTPSDPETIKRKVSQLRTKYASRSDA